MSMMPTGGARVPGSPVEAPMMPGDDAGGDGVDLRTLWFAFRRRLVLFMVIVSCVMVATAVVNAQLVEYYTAEARVLLDPREQAIAPTEAVLGNIAAEDADVETEIEIIRSPALIGRVVDDLNLVSDPEFNPLAPGKRGGLAALGDGIGRSVRSFFGLLSPGATDTADGEAAAPLAVDPIFERQLVIAEVRSRVFVRRLSGTYIIRIGVTSERPAMAAALANAIADKYLVEQLEGNLEVTRRANQWLQESLSGMQAELTAAEAEVSRVRLELGMPPRGSGGGDEVSLDEQQLLELSTQLVTQRADLQESQSRLAALRRELNAGRTVDDYPDIVQSDVITELRAQRVQLTREREANGNRLANHPEIRRIDRELAEVEERIGEEVARIVVSLEADVNVRSQRVAGIEREIAQLRASLGDNSDKLVELRDLERRVDALRTLYEGVLERVRETTILGNLEVSQARILMVAEMPLGPSAPNPKLNLVLGLVMAVALASGVVFLAETFDSGLRTPGDVQRFFGVRCLAMAPRVRIPGRIGRPSPSDVADYVVERPMSAYAEALRALRATVLLSREYPDAKVVAFASALSGEGKTSTVLSFARVAAMQGAKVVTIDFDLRRRELTRAARLEPHRGLADVLSGREAVDAVLMDDPLETGLKVLPLASGEFALPGVADLSGLQELLNQLRRDYDLIVVDTAPVLAVTETRVLAAYVDAVVFVAQWRNTARNAVRAGLQTLMSVSAPLVGVVLNRVNLSAQNKYDQGGGYYNQQYRKYYHD